MSSITFISPKLYEVIQRNNLNTGKINININIANNINNINKININTLSETQKIIFDWTDTEPKITNNNYNIKITMPAGGWYNIIISLIDSTNNTISTNNIICGIGEVFVITGQSNSVNFAENLLTPKTNKVVSYSDEKGWVLASDPQPGLPGSGDYGSFYPPFGDGLYYYYRVPIGFIASGIGGTSVIQWQPTTTFYSYLIARMKTYNGNFRAVLWIQGESDFGMEATKYANYLTNIIEQSNIDMNINIPWFVSNTSYINFMISESVRKGQQSLWNNIALQGPDTDTLIGSNRQDFGTGVHFSCKGQHNHAVIWLEKIIPWIDSQMNIQTIF